MSRVWRDMWLDACSRTSDVRWVARAVLWVVAWSLVLLVAGVVKTLSAL